jgi:Uma2 family endonuclease
MGTELAHVFLQVAPPGSVVLAGANVSDRVEGWEHNYRCPDVVVVLPGSAARDADTHWVGGPDLVVEVVSPNDRSLEKLGFYAALGVGEALLVNRDSKTAELFVLSGGRLTSAGVTSSAAPARLELRTIGLIVGSDPAAPRLLFAHPASGGSWAV